MVIHAYIQRLVQLACGAMAVVATTAVAALAVEVTPLAADGRNGGDTTWLLAGDGTPGYGSAERPKHPGWVFVGLVPQKTWETYGLRPPAFVVTGTRPFDPASAPVMIMPKGKSGRSGGSSARNVKPAVVPAPEKMPPVASPPAADAGKNGAAGNGGSPYSGSAPATGEVPVANAANGNGGKNEVLYPATGGVTHTRAASATQTDAALSNKPATPTEKSGAGAEAAYPAPRPRTGGGVSPIVLPPNNGAGALESSTK